jgi:hypothetical protein
MKSALVTFSVSISNAATSTRCDGRSLSHANCPSSGVPIVTTPCGTSARDGRGPLPSRGGVVT